MLTACAELGGLNKKDLQRILEERQTTLAQQKVVFTQLQDLLHQLQELHTQSQERWLCPRYFMLKRGVNSVLAAFGSVAGLSRHRSDLHVAAQTLHKKEKGLEAVYDQSELSTTRGRTKSSE